METKELSIALRLDRSQGRERRSRSFGTKLTRAEEAELYDAAKGEGKYVGEWARDVLLREARRAPDDALFTEVIATRMLLVNLIKPLLEGKTVQKDYVAEAMTAVRGVKRKAAKDVRQQYRDEDEGVS